MYTCINICLRTHVLLTFYGHVPGSWKASEKYDGHCAWTNWLLGLLYLQTHRDIITVLITMSKNLVIFLFSSSLLLFRFVQIWVCVACEWTPGHVPGRHLTAYAFKSSKDECRKSGGKKSCWVESVKFLAEVFRITYVNYCNFITIFVFIIPIASARNSMNPWERHIGNQIDFEFNALLIWLTIWKDNGTRHSRCDTSLF